MLSRSTSSRRRRQSRSAASPQIRTPRSAGTSPGRRASIAVSPVDSDRAIYRTSLAPEINRSPRHSIIPDISLESQDGSSPEDAPRSRSPRPSIAPDRSPRHSLVPNDYQRSPRNSLVPESALSPRNSLVPDSALSPRNSLVPDNFNPSPRNSLVPEYSKSPRNSITPENYNASPRNSIIPPEYSKSPRNSLVPEKRSPRHSLVPDYADFNRSPRNSLVPDANRSPRASLVPSDSAVWNEETSKSPRQSPRGSIGGDKGNSPRGSVEYISDRSPRGSIGPENCCSRSPRGSLVKNVLLPEERSPRGSLTLTFQEPPASDVRRYSSDNGTRANRSTSPYRSGPSKGSINLGYGSASGLPEGGSRRASSSAVSQVSGDEQRRLCAEQKKFNDGGPEITLGIASLTTYGSVAYQLKDANLEANNTCEFVCKALSIVNKTVIVTVVLVCLSTLPLLMFIMGIQFLRDCPREPHIPIYMVVGGSVGCIKMAWILWNQLHTRRMELGVVNTTSIGSRIASLALTVFLLSWFALGNYWILRIKWPDFAPTLFEPNRWCHRTLYVFSLVHLYVMYSVISAVVLLVIALAFSQVFGCPWLGPTRYK